MHGRDLGLVMLAVDRRWLRIHLDVGRVVSFHAERLNTQFFAKSLEKGCAFGATDGLGSLLVLLASTSIRRLIRDLSERNIIYF